MHALLVVELALEDGGARRLAGLGGAADVVGVEVRDEDPRDPQLLRERREGLVAVREREARVHERPAVVALEQVAVDVLRAERERPRQPRDPLEHMFYNSHVGVEYREQPCRSALNKVRGMSFKWSLNPYMGCVHRCTFCYVRAFERRADRPSDDRYGTSIRVKVNVAEVLARELARPSWHGDWVAVGAATDPYQPAEAATG